MDLTALRRLQLPDTTVDAVEEHPGDDATPASVRVTLTIAHPPHGAPVTVWVWLPAEGWNERFQGTGGGGFLGGSTDALLAPLRAGYAAAATDGGHPGPTASFALDEHGRLDWPRIRAFGHVAVHEMTVAAKAVVEAAYGRRPRFSYWNGCSTGGRQGLMEVQRHPGDYDGVLAGAPVINYPRMQTAQLWGQVVMRETGTVVSAAKFAAALAAVIDRCDTVGDGVVDGVIGDPLGAPVDLAALVGLPTPDGPLTEADVAVLRAIGEGPRRRGGEFLWYGLPPGAPFAGLHDSAVVDGELVGQPFVFDLWWFSLFLAQDPGWDWRTLTTAGFEAFFDQAVEMYSGVLAADDPDVRAFADRGGKALVWHGAADFGVPVQGTLHWYERVQRLLGPDRTHEFLRVFLAPGVGHCGGGVGPQPTGALEALVAWVEEGRAPEQLVARQVGPDGEVLATRPLFPYPRVARWTGEGDPADASSYAPAEGTRLELPPGS
ncbi:tannase/feruloyl esterase family alpha/beta hydrolase [Modestobacter sp. NPDC049651]|uniref:tannase/feruloyl esterase family alpha/beta hydrolase n=1 Tax=unclassified Modestobacter TaxID=2643866 RepID=UPI0033F02524